MSNFHEIMLSVCPEITELMCIGTRVQLSVLELLPALGPFYLILILPCEAQ